MWSQNCNTYNLSQTMISIILLEWLVACDFNGKRRWEFLWKYHLNLISVWCHQLQIKYRHSATYFMFVFNLENLNNIHFSFNSLLDKWDPPDLTSHVENEKNAPYNRKHLFFSEIKNNTILCKIQICMYICNVIVSESLFWVYVSYFLFYLFIYSLQQK